MSRFLSPLFGALAVLLLTTGIQQTAAQSSSSALSCPPPASGQFSACYYNNIGFTDLRATGTVPEVNFDFGAGSPHADVEADTFSATWTGNFYFEGGEYRFTATTDDGMRVLVDGQVVIDRLYDQPATTYTALRNIAVGTHEVRVEYYERNGMALARLGWERTSASSSSMSNSGSVSSSASSAPMSLCHPTGSGDTAWHLCYFNNQNLTDLRATQTINGAGFALDWGMGSPISSIDPDTFSATAQRNWYPENGTYAFQVRSDDGVRVYIDNQLVLDKWFDQPATTSTFNVPVSNASSTVPRLIRVEYYENNGNASLSFALEKMTSSSSSSSSSVSSSSSSSVSSVSSSAPAQGCDIYTRNAFNVCYYNAANLTDFSFRRLQGRLSANWGAGSPDTRIGADTFSLSSRAEFFVPRDSLYAFITTSDDGVRLWVDDQLLIDRWTDQPASTYAAVENLSAGWHRLRIEYYENGGNALLQLRAGRLRSFFPEFRNRAYGRMFAPAASSGQSS